MFSFSPLAIDDLFSMSDSPSATATHGTRIVPKELKGSKMSLPRNMLYEVLNWEWPGDVIRR